MWIAVRRLTRELQQQKFILSEKRLDLAVREEPHWLKYYLPINLEGKVVLDVGAGEGETAYFFLKHGAKQVVCIEPEPKAFSILLLNAKSHPQIIPIKKCFELADLDQQHDFLKVDIEGYEEILLQKSLQKPAVVEVHGFQLRDKFKKAGYRIAQPVGIGVNSYAFWKC